MLHCVESDEKGKYFEGYIYYFRQILIIILLYLNSVRWIGCFRHHFPQMKVCHLVLILIFMIVCVLYIQIITVATVTLLKDFQPVTCSVLHLVNSSDSTFFSVHSSWHIICQTWKLISFRGKNWNITCNWALEWFLWLCEWRYYYWRLVLICQEWVSVSKPMYVLKYFLVIVIYIGLSPDLKIVCSCFEYLQQLWFWGILIFCLYR